VAAAAEPTSMEGSAVERNGSAMEGQGSAAEGDDSIWEVTMMKVATVKKAEPKCGPYVAASAINEASVEAAIAKPRIRFGFMSSPSRVALNRRERAPRPFIPMNKNR
jgi:hypothetical protein